MDSQTFEKRREQVDYREALRAVHEEIGMAEKVSGEKMPGAQRGGLPQDATITVGGKPKQNQATPGPMEAIDYGMQPVYKAGAKVNDALAAGLGAAGRVVGLDEPSADFAGGVLGYQLPENNLDTALMAAPFFAGAIKGVRGAKGAAKATQAQGTVPQGTAHLAPTIKSEQDLKRVVDAPAGAGRTFVILTDEKPYQEGKYVQPGYQAGSLEQLIRKEGPYEQYRVTGKYKSGDENSFMLVSSKPNDQGLITKALRWAKAAGQESIGTNEGILYLDGRLSPKTGAAVYGEEAKLIEDGHSVLNIESGGQLLPFSMPIDWGKRVPSSYRHDYRGIGFTDQRFRFLSPGQDSFIEELPKGFRLKHAPPYLNEFSVPGLDVYDFKSNPLNMPSEGFEQPLKDLGYRAAIVYGEDGLPSLRTVDNVPISRTLDRNNAVLTMLPEGVPERVAQGTIVRGMPDAQTRKDLVNVGVAMLAQPELSLAKVAREEVALAKGGTKTFQNRLGRNFRATGADNMTHEDLHDAFAYTGAKDESAEPAVRKAWEDLMKQVEAQFDKMGVKVEHVDGQPYASAEEMIADFKRTGVLKISKDFNEHPVFSPDQNLKFRAWHDYKGHIEPGHTFGMAGERGTFDSSKHLVQGEDAQNALRVEVLGQAASRLASGDKPPGQIIFDLRKQRERQGLVEGTSADLYGNFVQQMEQRLPQQMRGQIGLKEYRGLFVDSVKGYKKFLKESAKDALPNTKTLLDLMNDSRGRAITEWYAHAWPELQRQFGADTELMARLLALFSPQAAVDLNVRRAYRAYERYKLGDRDVTSIMNYALEPKPVKGEKGAPDPIGPRILDPEDLDSISNNLGSVLRNPEVELSGRKVSNFLAAIKGDLNAVVIDRHMGGIFGYKNINDGVYTIIEEHVRMLASEMGVRPAEAQAILWGSWKATKGQAKELANLDVLLKDYAATNKHQIPSGMKRTEDGLFERLKKGGSALNEDGFTQLQAAFFLAKVFGGGLIGGAYGDSTEEHMKNALIGVGLGFLASKPVVRKIATTIRENAPAKWFKPAGEAAPPVPPNGITPDDAMRMASEEAEMKARLDALRNKPKTVTVGDVTYELDLHALDTPEQIKQAVDEMAKVYKQQLDTGTLAPGSRGVIPNALAKRLGEHLNVTEEDVLARTRGSVDAVEHVFAYAEVMDAAKSRAMTSYALFTSGHKAVEADFVRDIDRYVQVGYQLAGLLEELGRGLQAGGVSPVKGLTQGFKGFSGPFEILQRHGSINGESLAALVKEAGLEKTAAIGKAVEKAGLWDMVAEITYGFTLSNPRSSVVNVASSSVLNPILSTMTRNMAETVGSGAVINGEARAMLYGYFAGAQRMMKAVGETYRKEGGVLNLLKSIRDIRPVGETTRYEMTGDGLAQAASQADKSGVGRKAITGENVSALMPKPFQFDPAGWLGRLVDGAGSAIRYPSVLMELGDHFGYAVNYDMAMHARAFREGVKQGKDGKALEAFIEQEIQNPSPAIKREAEQFAKHEIFKQFIDGHPGKIVDGLGHPAMRPFITFVRTPVNIFRYNLEGVPVLNLALKGVRDDLAAGGARRDLALAKMTLGGTIAALAGMFATQDRLTGNGPDNAKLRSLWLIDHKPYSVKLPYTDQWMSYKYFDPVSAWFGMAADAAHFMSFDKDDLTGGEMAMSIVLGLARNFADKTYTRDTFEFLDQLSVRPGENAQSALDSFERYADKKALTYVPFSSLSRAMRNTVDPAVREAFTLLEKTKNSIPGWSESLPEKLDFFGDPIVNPRFNSFLPFPMGEDTGDGVVDELLHIRANVGMPSKVLDGEDLSVQDYHDLVDMRGKGLKAVLGKDLREALIETFNAPEYRALETTDAVRRLMVETVVEGYTQAAHGALSQAGNTRFLKYRQAQKRAEELTGQALNLNFGR